MHLQTVKRREKLVKTTSFVNTIADGVKKQVSANNLHKHNTVHHIQTTPGPPVSCRPRRLAPAKLAAAKKEFEEMIRVGTARPSKSPWSSPLYLAPKGDHGWWLCGD